MTWRAAGRRVIRRGLAAAPGDLAAAPGDLAAAPGDNDRVDGASQAGIRARRLAAATLRAPVSGRTWRELLYWLAGLPLGVAGFAVVIAPLAIGTALTLPLVGAALGVLFLMAGLAVAGSVSAGFRRLAARLLDLRLLVPPERPRGRGVLGRVEARLRDGGSWRAVGYVALRLPLAYVGSGLIAAFWGSGLFFLTYPLWWSGAHRQALEPHRKHGLAWALSPFPAGDVHITTVGGAFAVMAIAIPVLLAAPWASRAVVLADTWLMRHVLTSQSLASRVRELERARALAVDDAAARLRRVERDLHDGAQARLVAIAMTLGMAREKLGTDGADADPARARALVDAAHLSARQAIAELRDLARGIHPPVLDNGLPDALATLAAQSPVPVAIRVDITQRPTASIEAIAYFCAAELIANIGKHSAAAGATLEASLRDGCLRLVVADDGGGGATVRAGGGLAGLAERVATVDGSIQISSPAGGPTAVAVQLPMHA